MRPIGTIGCNILNDIMKRNVMVWEFTRVRVRIADGAILDGYLDR